MFVDRRDAGRQLASALLAHPDTLGDAPSAGDVVVLALPRGGVPVAREVADILGATLDVLVVRKLGVPGQPELAMGAVGEGGVRVLNNEVQRSERVSGAQLAEITERELDEVARRAEAIRQVLPRVDLDGRTAVIVDDGVATGATARAACEVAVAHHARRVVVAVPVAPRGWSAQFRGAADACIAVETPRDFRAVGLHYAEFLATTDDEVLECLAR